MRELLAFLIPKDLSVIAYALKLCGTLALAGAFLLAVYTVAAAPSRVSSILGLRGLKRQRAIANSEGWAGIEPLVRWAGARVSGFLSDSQRDELNRQIALAGDFCGLTAEEYLALFFLGPIGGGLVGGGLGALLDMGPLPLIGGIIFGAAAPYLTISGEAQNRMRGVAHGLPYMIDLMALSMSAGLDFPGALRQVVDKSSNPDDPLVEEFTLILQSLSVGRTRRDALIEFARRVPAASITEFVNSLVQAEERGNPIAEVLQIQAATARGRRSVRAEELAAKAGVKMTLPLMLVFIAVLGLILAPAFMNIQSGLG